MNDRLQALVDHALALTQERTRLEAELADTKQRLNTVQLEDLPELLRELGITEAKLPDGTKITLKEDVKAALTEKTRAAGVAWLEEHGFSSLVKYKVALECSDHEEAARQATLLGLKESEAVVKTVHPQTLRAFVREQLAAGTSIPLDAFNVHPYEKAEIRSKK